MKPPSDDQDLIRWLDGEMNETERGAFDARLKGDPILKKEAEALRALSLGIRTHLPAEMAVPHPDFFNSQIQVRIAQMEIDEKRAAVSGASPLTGLLNWLRRPWLVAVGAAAVAVLGFLWMQPLPEMQSESFILSSYAPDARVSARTFHDDAADATVLMLDGLDAVPAEKKISGISVQRSVTEPEFAATTLYGTEGIPLLVIWRDAAGNPSIRAQTPRG